MKKICTAVFCMIVFTSVSPKTLAQKPVSISKTEFSIQSPAGWVIDSSKQMGTSLILFSMLENSADKFRENVNVLIQNIAGRNIDLQQYTSISINQIKSMATDGVILESAPIKKGNTTYQKLVYTATQGGFKLKFEQYYFVTKTRAFAVTLTAEAAKFDAYKTTGEAILNSFVVK